ncbi:spore germination protein [Bacillus sp. AFS076308]|uniref:spore germination protein n=1 Tax=unclassified Bacillus (in: firmicutes) TaxID=185979 RepID=UPI000BFAAE0F|nr:MULTISPECIES: spore germination protein [unclassified Bacillus (in: firmicutes)]PFO09614.1 spore germination protein [Bacillus sp. AFS076308]PGV54780.1 spore germination protein [Bacillus sp. AFS037270]
MKSPNNDKEQGFQDSEEQNWVERLSKSNDFVHEHTSIIDKDPFWLSYFRTLISSDILHKDVLPYLQEQLSLEELKSKIPVQEISIINDKSQIIQKLLNGYIAVQKDNYNQEILLINIANSKFRDVGIPTIESSALGPQVGFIEELDTNINLIRKRLPAPDLLVKELKVGELSKTRVAVIYMDGIADPENVNTVVQRIKDVQYDQILDSSYIAAMIEDNSHSLFPQSISTERPDRVAAGLSEGKIIIAADGSPNLIILPVTFIESFIAIEDYSFTWIISNFIRLLRFISSFLAALVSPLYVAVLTYHYELIPSKLLENLVGSRVSVPFPPFLEALILEIMIEMVKEAGIRLPTKIGQSLGVVGGIVIGQAVVEAGLTSNVLLILVGLGTLASYIAPVYKFSNTIRFIKFPLIILAQWLGLFGVFTGLSFITLHLLRLTSLGRPYLSMYPLRKTAFQDLWVRLPFSMQKERPQFLRPQKKEKSTGNEINQEPLNDFYE